MQLAHIECPQVLKLNTRLGFLNLELMHRTHASSSIIVFVQSALGYIEKQQINCKTSTRNVITKIWATRDDEHWNEYSRSGRTLDNNRHQTTNEK